MFLSAASGVPVPSSRRNRACETEHGDERHAAGAEGGQGEVVATGAVTTGTTRASRGVGSGGERAHIAARTSTIRVGSGGVMLPNHAPLSVAEQFAMLEALHPGRIDLGVGRAPLGSPSPSAHHFVGGDTRLAAELYRRAFEPSPAWPSRTSSSRPACSWHRRTRGRTTSSGRRTCCASGCAPAASARS